MERAKQSPILADKEHIVVLNGIDADVFHPYDNSDLRAKHGISDDEKIIFHATAAFNSDPNHIKGGFYVLELAKRLLNKNIKIFVAGTYDLSIASPENVIFLGHISDQNLLAQYYSMADMTLLTSKKETFSMICAESLCCGTPVVGFKAGAPEQITISEYSSFVEFADIESLQKETEKMLNQAYDRTIISQVAKYKYSTDVMVNDYKTVYLRLMK
jgi:glycosyltransferase involved in cell wall biosynthesis